MFPPGWPGFALLLLRVSAAVTGMMSVTEWYHQTPGLYLLGAIPVAAALCAGFLTPLAALLAIAVHLLRFAVSSGNALWVGVTIANTLALAMLGPGAYSVDALFFGRRLLLTNRDQ
jgi:hypothetical protein